MKLYLSSYKFGNNPEYLIDLVGSNKKVGIIMNATDVFDESKRPVYLAKEADQFATFGMQAEQLDLRHYFKDNDRLASKLEEYGLIWVMGGNAFVLRKAMAMSGFDNYAANLINSESLVYAGFSAGAIMATPSLHGIEIMDEAEATPEKYQDEIIWDCLNLINFSIVPHFQSDHPESELATNAVAYMQEHNMKYKAMRDGEAFMVNGPKAVIVGASKSVS